MLLYSCIPQPEISQWDVDHLQRWRSHNDKDGVVVGVVVHDEYDNLSTFLQRCGSCKDNDDDDNGIDYDLANDSDDDNAPLVVDGLQRS